MTNEDPEWLKKQNQARAARDKTLPEQWKIPADKLPKGDELTGSVIDFPHTSGLLSTEELEITELNVPALLDAIKHKKYSAEKVATAYAHRAAIAHQLTNCLSYMFFERGIERAKQLDEYYEKEGKLIGPLHGLPVSIKDQHHIDGTPAGVGIINLSAELSTTNSATAQILTKLGAVLYCKTAVPIGLMAIDTHSRVLGITTNPHNRAHTPGGSSGGEGALTALGGSPIGIGSDIGGSIRVPASHCAVYGIKGTSARFPTAGQKNAIGGQAHIKSVSGVLARDLESIDFFTNIFLNEGHPELYDNVAIPLGWRKLPPLKPKLKFGLFKSGDGVVRLVNGVVRALDTAAEALRAEGHEVVEFTPPDFAKLWSQQWLFFANDGGEQFYGILGDEPPLEHADLQAIKALVSNRSGSETWAAQRLRLEIETKLFEQWQKNEIDALIAPVNNAAGLTHKTTMHNGYTVYWNIVDYPGVVVPVTEIQGEQDGISGVAESPSIAEQKAYAAWSPESAKNGQIGLQVITQRYEDEKAVALARVLDNALKNRK